MNYNKIRESIRTRVESNNEKVLAALVKQLRSPVGVIPFLGAGLSAPFKYPQWGAFLSRVASEQLSEKENERAENQIAEENYLKAAAIIAKCLGAEDFQQAISEEFSDDKLWGRDLTAGTCGYLPLITAGPVITTNFDRVIEHIFECARAPLEDRVYGANPDEVITAIQQNRRVLWKIHGDRGDRRTRVFIAAEYRQHYKNLHDLLLFAFLNRPVLFIGSSLEQDRTTRVLEYVRKRHPGTSHFGFVPIPDSDSKFYRRVKALRTMGVRPIWYPEGKYKEIENYLSDVVHEISSRPLEKAALKGPSRQMTDAETAKRVLSKEIEIALDSWKSDLKKRSDLAKKGYAPLPEEKPPYTPMLAKIVSGQMAFFLGAAACMHRMPLGRQFYQELIAQFDDESSGVRSEKKYTEMKDPQIAQHFVDKYDRDTLYSQVKRQLEPVRPEPTAIHWFIATLPQRLRAKGIKAKPPWVFTTNYDEWMEDALRYLRLRYHLFTYRISEPYSGSFVYQRPKGKVYVVDRPSHFHRLPEDCFVLVKLHGGQHSRIDLPISYVFTQRDFVELAGRMPQAIPKVIMDRLDERSLLFLGSGLGDDSIESIVRHMHQQSPNKLSWAIQWEPLAEKRLYWRQLGVEIIHTSLQTFIKDLDRELENWPTRGYKE